MKASIKKHIGVTTVITFLVMVVAIMIIILSDDAKIGDVLFPIDQLTEMVIISLSSDGGKIDARITFSRERIQELKSAIQKLNIEDRALLKNQPNRIKALIKIFNYTNSYLKETRGILLLNEDRVNIAILNSLTNEMLKIASEIESLQVPAIQSRLIQLYGKSDDNSRVQNCPKIKEQNVGLTLCSENVSLGLTLIQTRVPNIALLIDGHGKIANSWGFERGSITYDIELLPNGSVIRSVEPKTSEFNLGTGVGGATGILERVDWNGNVEWQIKFADDKLRLHHDIEVLPNGNILAIAWEHISPEEAVAAGYDPRNITGNGLWPDVILEIKPLGINNFEIVWQWRFWDHIFQKLNPTLQNYGSQQSFPDKIDINLSPKIVSYAANRNIDANVLDCNDLDYLQELNLIFISCGNSNEIYIIRYGTEEGILNRFTIEPNLGNKYRRDAFFNIHHVNATLSNSNMLNVIASSLYLDFQNSRNVGVEYIITLTKNLLNDIDLSLLAPSILEGKSDGGDRFATSPFKNATLPRFQYVSGGNMVTVTRNSFDVGIIQLNKEKEMVWNYVIPITENGVVLSPKSTSSNENQILLSNAIWYPYEYLAIPVDN